MEQQVNKHAPVILTLSAPLLAAAISGMGWIGYSMVTNQSAMTARQVEIKRDISSIEQSLTQYQTKSAAQRMEKSLDARMNSNELAIRKHGNSISRLDERVDRLERR